MTEKRRIATGSISLRKLAEHLGLNPATVSVVLNDVPGRSIPQVTRDRIKAAARELNYQPNFFARSLRKRRSYTIGVLTREIGDMHTALVIAGIESFLRQKEYSFLTGAHGGDPELLGMYCNAFAQRGVEGLIAVNTELPQAVGLPAVQLATQSPREQLTDVGRAAAQALLTEIEQFMEQPSPSPVPRLQRGWTGGDARPSINLF